MSASLESNYTSQNLHHWIDLIFGDKSRGEKAVYANNIFQPMTYAENVNIESINNEIEKAAIEFQVYGFG